MIYFDTNTLIRFFTNDEPKKAQKVKRLLDTEKGIVIPDVVLPEIVYVLGKTYRVSRADIIAALGFLASKTNIQLSTAVYESIRLFRQTSLDMADCMIAASAQGETLASFDKDLLKVPRFKPYWPAAS